MGNLSTGEILLIVGVAVLLFGGHLTDRMREHYSTVTPVEQRESIGRVLRLVTLGSTTTGGAPNAESGAPREEVAS